MNIKKIRTVTGIELSCINKLLIKFYLLQKLFILDTYFFFSFNNVIRHSIYIKNALLIKNINKNKRKNNQYYVMADLKKKV